jgi:hypothetical protein
VTGYDAIFSAILEEIEAITTLQWPHVKHVTDPAWDIHRCRLKANIINLARIEAVGALLTLSLSALLARSTRVSERDMRRVATNLQCGSETKCAGAPSSDRVRYQAR